MTGRDPFRVLVACLLSLRTQDSTTGPAAARLFAVADTPAALLRLAPRDIERLIYPVGFYRTKARVILALSRDLLDRPETRDRELRDAAAPQRSSASFSKKILSAPSSKRAPLVA